MNEKTKCYCVDARIRMCGKRARQVLALSTELVSMRLQYGFMCDVIAKSTA